MKLLLSAFLSILEARVAHSDSCAPSDAVDASDLLDQHVMLFHSVDGLYPYMDPR